MIFHYPDKKKELTRNIEQSHRCTYNIIERETINIRKKNNKRKRKTMNNKNKVTDKKKNIFIEDIQQSTNERKTTQITIRSFIFFHTFLFIFF